MTWVLQPAAWMMIMMVVAMMTMMQAHIPARVMGTDACMVTHTHKHASLRLHRAVHVPCAKACMAPACTSGHAFPPCTCVRAGACGAAVGIAAHATLRLLHEGPVPGRHAQGLDTARPPAARAARHQRHHAHTQRPRYPPHPTSAHSTLPQRAGLHHMLLIQTLTLILILRLMPQQRPRHTMPQAGQQLVPWKPCHA